QRLLALATSIWLLILDTPATFWAVDATFAFSCSLFTEPLRVTSPFLAWTWTFCAAEATAEFCRKASSTRWVSARSVSFIPAGAAAEGAAGVLGACAVFSVVVVVFDDGVCSVLSAL